MPLSLLVSNPRILIIRTSAMGDIVQALPVLSALRRHHPSATIGWVIEDVFAPLLENHPDIDQLLPVSLRIWRRRPLAPHVWRDVMASLGRIQDFSAEIVIDLMGNHKAGILAALSCGERRLGASYATRREPSSAIWISEPVDTRGRHAVDRMLSVLDGLGLPAEDAVFDGQRLPEATAMPTPVDSPYALIHPATGWRNKDYPATRWAAVAERLAATGVEILLAPGPGEETLAESIRAVSHGRCLVLDPLPFSELVFMQRRAALVLGGDTGPIHLAHALGTPVLCVMGPTDPARHGPYNAPERTVSVRLPCSFCYRRLDSAKACLLEIDPETVADRALEMLDFEFH